MAKTSARSLFESEQAFRILVQGVADYALYMLDLEGHITSWNLGGQRIKGYSSEEIIGQHFSRFYTPADREASKPSRALQIARETGRYEEEGLRVRKDGSFFWASVVIDPIYDDDGELIGFAKITRDITERREAQHKLERIQRQLAESQKLDALGQLTGGVAHDFNNLLMAVTGNTRIIKRYTLDSRIVKAAESIEAIVQRGAALTRQLLTFARRQQVNPILITVPETIHSVKEVLSTGLGRIVTLVLDTPNHLWPVLADPAEFETALVNLVLNARDAMPEGGTVAIAAENRHFTDGEHSGDHVCITVSDSGVGIPDDIAAKVFDPFFTTKPVGKGTGLGLSQVHGFVNQAGGWVAIKSVLGEGTRVTLCLPRGEGRVDAAAEQMIASGMGTVLLVEDNPDVASASTGLLEELGYNVKWVSDAEAAIREIERESITIVFSDVVMPGKIDGIGLARRLKESHPGLPILLATGYSDAARKSNREFPILRKPYQLHELSQALQDLLNA